MWLSSCLKYIVPCFYPCMARSVRLFSVQGQYSICYSAVRWPRCYCTNRRNMQRLLQSPKNSVCNSFKKISENEVQCKLCQVKLAHHKSTSTIHSHLRAKHSAEGEILEEWSNGSQWMPISTIHKMQQLTGGFTSWGYTFEVWYK